MILLGNLLIHHQVLHHAASFDVLLASGEERAPDLFAEPVTCEGRARGHRGASLGVIHAH